MLKAVLPLAALTAAVACAPIEEDADFISDAPAARVTGEAESCIDASRIRTTRVHDDRTIDFEMIGNTTYRSTLPYKCPRLGFEEAISYDVRGGQLCSTDIVYVLNTIGGGAQRGAACGLGEFVPVELIEDEDG